MSTNFMVDNQTLVVCPNKFLRRLLFFREERLTEHICRHEHVKTTWALRSRVFVWRAAIVCCAHTHTRGALNHKAIPSFGYWPLSASARERERKSITTNSIVSMTTLYQCVRSNWLQAVEHFGEHFCQRASFFWQQWKWLNASWNFTTKT